MKKFLPIITAVALCVTPVFAEEVIDESSTGVSVSEMSDMELSVLYNQVKEEMAKRSLGEMDIHRGFYVVGEDIKAERFTLTAYDCLVYTSCIIYESVDKYNQCVEEDGWEFDYALTYADVDLGKSIDVNLKDGQVLVIEKGSFYIEPANVSWAP